MDRKATQVKPYFVIQPFQDPVYGQGSAIEVFRILGDFVNRNYFLSFGVTKPFF